MRNQKNKITIFTPTHNRAYIIGNLYKSLCHQTNKDFEWVIVDDGSTDETTSLIKGFKEEGIIDIIYYLQENKGKHVAINKGVELAIGELFFIVDSDDRLTNNAVEKVLFHYEGIKNNNNFAGLGGTRIYPDGTRIGGVAEFKTLNCNALDFRLSYGIKGDMAEVFRTTILRDFPFPEIKDEKFCPEALVWNRIAQKYKLLYFNFGIYTTEYLPDGLTAKIVKIRMTSPIASMLCYSELASYKIPFIQKIKATLNFWRFSFNSKKNFIYKLSSVNLVLSTFCIPLGYIMYCNDKKKWL